MITRHEFAAAYRAYGSARLAGEALGMSPAAYRHAVHRMRHHAPKPIVRRGFSNTCIYCGTGIRVKQKACGPCNPRRPLTDDERAAIVKAYADGVTTDAIVLICGRSRGTVSWVVAQAIKAGVLTRHKPGRPYHKTGHTPGRRGGGDA